MHYCAHHDPYDTVDLAREVGDVFEQMARVALAPPWTPRGCRRLRVAPARTAGAVCGQPHRGGTHDPRQLYRAGHGLAMEGFDVDLIPYGQAVTAADLEDADLVVVLPVLDFPTTHRAWTCTTRPGRRRKSPRWKPTWPGAGCWCSPTAPTA